MSSWQKTSCICCAQNCGLEVLVEDNRIVKVRPDKENPRSEGYVCRKGLKIGHYQHNAARLTHPLKRIGDGFEQISWDLAIEEIADKLKQIIGSHGPRSLAYMGGGGQGCHFEAAFGVRLLRSLGSQYHYSALGQELTGMFWAHGRALGRQYLHTIPDEHETDMLLAIGWNGWMSHQMVQARRHLKRISEDPDKLLVVIDPRRSELAERANIHLAIRPGTDALLTRAMIAIILQEGLHDTKYLEEHVSGFDAILPWFADFDARAAVKVCELDYDRVRDVCRLFATRRSSLHADLGILMSRHSTVTSYLEIVLLAICGRMGVRGGNVIAGYLMPLGSHSDEREEKTWRTTATGFPAIMGVFPPNVMPEEITSGRADRLRAVLVSGSNPLRSYADTSAYEEAFRQLDLLVTIDVVMSETAMLSHYVLPATSAYEKWDAAFFSWTYPEVYFQLRRPVVQPQGEPLDESEILTRLADKLGILPEIPTSLYDAARSNRMQFGMALMQYAQAEPSAMKLMPFILGKTLGPVLGSANTAALWGLLQIAPKSFRENAGRAGFDPGMAMGEQLFQAILDHPEGLWIGKCDTENNLGSVQTADGKIDLHIPELAEWVQSITAEKEEAALRPDPEYPLILTAGRHFDYNANTIMRDPAWNDGRDACTMLMHPADAEALGLENGQMVRIATEAGQEEVRLEVTDAARAGQVVVPHGFGLSYEGETYGANVNRLAKNTNRDRLAGTPLHRYVPCRVEAL
ncbi:MAG: molybdopterin-dependent oxidoreductase [Desulfomonilaceae bacterium]|nr:molybdopterin-dependent oxidoreductase [Desulfomonilaceae bacterium]